MSAASVFQRIRKTGTAAQETLWWLPNDSGRYRSEPGRRGAQTAIAEAPLYRSTILPGRGFRFSSTRGALFLERLQFRYVEVPLFLFAVAIATWYGGTGAAVLALLLSCLTFDYFFVEPLYTLNVSLADLPYFIVFAAFATLVTWFSIVRRRVERELRQARDDLVIEVAERTQQASLLDLTHDTIFVRDMSDAITYWNRGAQELFGWTAEEAIGQRAHELLQSVFPVYD